MCALCRGTIPANYLENPSVVNRSDVHAKLCLKSKKYHWFYEGKNGGWWMYEEKTSDELEEGFSRHVPFIKIQISGFMYVIDYEKMLQVREDHPNRKRKIKRDILECDGLKGIAGLPFEYLK